MCSERIPVKSSRLSSHRISSHTESHIEEEDTEEIPSPTVVLMGLPSVYGKRNGSDSDGKCRGDLTGLDARLPICHGDNWYRY
jgi:hypothetical protein